MEEEKKGSSTLRYKKGRRSPRDKIKSLDLKSRKERDLAVFACDVLPRNKLNRRRRRKYNLERRRYIKVCLFCFADFPSPPLRKKSLFEKDTGVCFLSRRSYDRCVADVDGKGPVGGSHNLGHHGR